MYLQYINEQIHMIEQGWSILGNDKLRLKILRAKRAEIMSETNNKGQKCRKI